MPALKTIAAILYWAKYFLDGNFGYSKMALARWSGLKNGKAHSPGDFDCTSIIGAILYLAGYIPLALIQGTWWSGNLADKLEAQGWRRISAKGKSLAWLNEHVTAGAVLVGPSHGVLGLGDGWILSWEYSEHHTDCGTVGRQKGEVVGKRHLYLRSKGWADLLLPPADATSTTPSVPVVSSTPAPLAFHVAFSAQQAPRFGGSKNYTARGRELKALGASVLGLTETLITAKGERPDAMRNGIRAVLGKAWKTHVHSGGAICLMWDSTKWKYGQLVSRLFAKSDPWHGTLRVPLYRRDAKLWIDFIVMHNRPKTVATLAQKKAFVRQVLDLVRPGKITILMGDWALDADPILIAAGWVRVTPHADSYDPAGIQAIDAIYIRPGQLAALGGRLVKMLTTDHSAAETEIVRAAVAV